MNTPEWKDAPEWAQYVAMDESGDWFWYEKKPVVIRGQPRWTDFGHGRYLWTGCKSIRFQDTLTRRPDSN